MMLPRRVGSPAAVMDGLASTAPSMTGFTGVAPRRREPGLDQDLVTDA
ncbi:hypothetical protein BBB_0549 [Bifidobacterium bifidum BGN4]|uniref:Uncharacterized protein n=2 Tax=Bifidobacterium bifidum TaxID=1681 RepID=I3WGY0_BIFBI|nr:hypothetical protein BBB_0549 [Bifidobacterium bifidum BGN4]ALE11023.1 Hypothetical protein RY70_658 [Bifidobacterium bifidum]KWZ81981.1 hypothetical protein HMPREF3196_00564 [Bifidobacterium bifidum]